MIPDLKALRQYQKDELCCDEMTIEWVAKQIADANHLPKTHGLSKLLSSGHKEDVEWAIRRLFDGEIKD